MSELINNIIKISDTEYLKHRSESKVVFEKDGLIFEAYDTGSLVGSKLHGQIGGTGIYLVHDSDNYDKDSTTHRHMFTDAVKDAEHLAKMFSEEKIKLVEKVEKGWFRSRRKFKVEIPDSKGTLHLYNIVSVNTSDFSLAD